MLDSEEIVLITPDKVAQIRQEIKDSLIKCRRICNPISPRMRLVFHVHPEERYESDVGVLKILTPVWRGKTFTEAVIMHELLRWCIYPKDKHRLEKDILTARRMLAKELSFKPKKTNSLYDDDWTGFGYTLNELAFAADMLGRYLVNLHLYYHYNDLWNKIWHYFHPDAAFLSSSRWPPKIDYIRLLYLVTYPKLMPNLQKINLNVAEIESDSRKIATLIEKTRKGEMSKAFALKELTKIIHKYLKRMDEERRNKGNGFDQENTPKCPRCGSEEFEIVAYQDEKTGSWITLKEGST
ncbi:MAG: hypothetical protein QW468_02395 [Candidatus Bathyarchaeia archaeon]